MIQHLPPIKDLVPHREPMLLLDGLTEVGSLHCRAVHEVRAGNWYSLPDGSMPAWLGIELMAQTVSAWSGWNRPDGKSGPRPGFLLGTRLYSSCLPSFPLGALLEIEVRQEYKDQSGLAAFECEIVLAREVVAQALLKVYEEP